MLQPVSDPNLIARLQQRSGGASAPSSAPAVDNEQEPGFFTSAPDASFGTALKDQIAAAGDAMIAGLVSEDNSRYANRRAQQSARTAAAETAKLSTIGQLGVGAAKYAPAIAAGMVNPLAGAGVAGTIATGDIAAGQAEAGQDVNLNTAAAGGAATAAADLLTGGAAAPVVSKMLPVAGGAVRRAVTGAVGGAIEDVPSAMAQQAIFNVSTGKDAGEGMDEAGVTGLAASLATRGILHGAGKVKDTLSGAQKTANNTGAPVAPSSVEGAAQHASDIEATRKAMDNAKDESQLSSLIDEHQNAVMSDDPKNLASSTFRVADFMDKAGMKMPLSAYDTSIQTSLKTGSNAVNVGELLGFDKKAMERSSEAMEGGKSGIGADLSKTTVGDKKEFQQAFQDANGTIRGNIEWNKVQGNSVLDQFKGTAFEDKAKQLKTAMDQYTSLYDKMATKNYTSAGDVAALHAKKIDQLSRELGVQNNFRDIFTGEAGKFDPLQNAQDYHVFEALSRSRMPDVYEGSPTPAKDTSGAGPLSAATIVGTGMLNPAAGMAVAGTLAVHKGFKELGAARSRAKLAKAREEGVKITKELAARSRNIEVARAAREAEVDQHLKNGDFESAADASSRDLGAEDIKVPESMAKPIETMEPESISEPISPVAPKDREVAPEQVPEEEVAPEAPVTPPEPIQERTAPLAPTRPAPRTEVPVEPVVAPAPEPLPVPKRKAPVEEPAPVEPEPVVAPEPVEAPVEAPKSEPLPVPKRKVEEAPEPVQEPTGPTPEEVAAQKEAKKVTVMSMAKKLDEQIEKEQAKPLNKRDPLTVSKLMKEREDLNRLTSTLAKETKAGESITDDDVARWIDEKGGIDALRSEAADKGRGKSFDAYVRQQFTNDMNAKIAEAKGVASSAKGTAAKALKTAREALQAEKIAGKHQRIRDELDMLGYPKEIVDEAITRGGAADTSKDFSPADVRKFAKMRYAQSAEKAQADLRAAQEKATKAATVAKGTLEAQRSEVKELLKGVNVSQDPEVTKIVKKALGNREKPLSDIEMKRLKDTLEDHFATQQHSYEQALKGNREASPVEIEKYKAAVSSYKNTAAQIREVRAKQEASQKANLAEAQKAAQELQQKHDMYDQMFVQGERKIADAESKVAAIEKQEKDLHQFMVDSKIHDEVAQQVLHQVMNGRTKPLTDEQFNKIKHTVLAKADKLDQAAVAKVKEAVSKDVDKLDRVGAEALADDLIQNSDLKEASDVSQRGLVEALSDKLKEEGSTDKLAAMDKFFSIIQKGDRRKAMFPDNKEMIISGEDYQDLQRLMSKSEGSHYMGNLGKRLALHFLGSREADQGLFHLNEEILRKAEATGEVPKKKATVKRLPFRKRVK